MKSPRPSVIAAALSEKPNTQGEDQAVAKDNGRRDVQHTSIYLPRPAYERLREIAFHERRKMHELLMEGVDLVIAKRGHSERGSRS